MDKVFIVLSRDMNESMEMVDRVFQSKDPAKERKKELRNAFTNVRIVEKEVSKNEHN
jgi:hypothetical protein